MSSSVSWCSCWTCISSVLFSFTSAVSFYQQVCMHIYCTQYLLLCFFCDITLSSVQRNLTPPDDCNKHRKLGIWTTFYHFLRGSNSSLLNIRGKLPPVLHPSRFVTCLKLCHIIRIKNNKCCLVVVVVGILVGIQ